MYVFYNLTCYTMPKQSALSVVLKACWSRPNREQWQHTHLSLRGMGRPNNYRVLRWVTEEQGDGMERGKAGAWRALGSPATQPGMWGCQRPSPKPPTGGKEEGAAGPADWGTLGSRRGRAMHHVSCSCCFLIWFWWIIHGGVWGEG